ncbi:MAG: hypothetical protein Q9209_003912 [Squamulea sp. 1 TL-2023]
MTPLIRHVITRQQPQRERLIILAYRHAAAEFASVIHKVVHQSLDRKPGDPSDGDMIALEEDADGTDEPMQVASAEDMLVFVEEFEVRKAAAGEGGFRVGGGTFAGEEGAVELGENVGRVDGCKGALGGAFAVDTSAGGVTAAAAAAAAGVEWGGEESEEDAENGFCRGE